MGSSSSSVTDVEFVEGQVEGPEMEYEKCHNISNIHYCMPDYKPRLPMPQNLPTTANIRRSSDTHRSTRKTGTL